MWSSGPLLRGRARERDDVINDMADDVNKALIKSIVAPTSLASPVRVVGVERALAASHGFYRDDVFDYHDTDQRTPAHGIFG